MTGKARRGLRTRDENAEAALPSGRRESDSGP